MCSIPQKNCNIKEVSDFAIIFSAVEKSVLKRIPLSERIPEKKFVKKVQLDVLFNSDNHQIPQKREMGITENLKKLWAHPLFTSIYHR